MGWPACGSVIAPYHTRDALECPSPRAFICSGTEGGDMSDQPGFRFSFDAPVLRGGRDCISTLGAELETHGLDRAMVVCGQTVGSTRAVIDPVEAGLGDRHIRTFDETTPEKRLSTALDAAEQVREGGIDVLVGLGGGSSLDITSVAAMLAADDRSREAIGAEFEERGTISPPDAAPYPFVAVPTTLAGADLSMAAGLTADPATGSVSEPVDGGVAHPGLMPLAVVADPELVATTPRDILAASAMNGFDKGIESLYARSATPITDATATHGLSLLRWSLPALGQSRPPVDAVESVVEEFCSCSTVSRTTTARRCRSFTRSDTASRGRIHSSRGTPMG
ncbi:MAG: iron-containing alcohol dehydrogenase [Natrialbaceae archaeon]|nr:iron-containing alcohol dehydrogenase [Natrialbaceae archaeon]